MMFVLLFSVYYYQKFIINSQLILYRPSQFELISSSIGMNFLALFFIVFFLVGHKNKYSNFSNNDDYFIALYYCFGFKDE